MTKVSQFDTSFHLYSTNCCSYSKVLKDFLSPREGKFDLTVSKPLIVQLSLVLPSHWLNLTTRLPLHVD